MVKIGQMWRDVKMCASVQHHDRRILQAVLTTANINYPKRAPKTRATLALEPQMLGLQPYLTYEVHIHTLQLSIDLAPSLNGNQVIGHISATE